MRKKTLIILVSIFMFLAICASLSYYFFFVMPRKDIAQRCANYVPNWDTFVECYGIISLTDSWDSNYISLKDHVHSYEVARIYNLNQYREDQGKIFVINRNTIEGSVSNGERVKYYQELFQNGEVVTNYYDTVSDIPTYLVVDYYSGEVEAFTNINDLPSEYRPYFLSLLDK